MPKTINYELAKKLYDAGVVIESEWRWCIGWDKCETEWTLIHKDDESASYTDFYPAPNTWEVIEFLKKDISIWYSEIFSQYVLSHKFLDRDIFRDTLIEALEATLEYLLDNWYIWKIK